MSEVNIQLSKDLIAPIIEAKIAAAIMEHTGDPGMFVSRIVSAALKTKVDKNGNVSDSHYYNTESFLDVVCTKTIQAATRKAIESWVEKNQPLIQQAVEKELNAKKGPMARAFATGLANSIKSDWRFNCDVKFESPKD